MIHIPAHQPLRILAVAIAPRHGRKLLCVATQPDHLQPMRDALADHPGMAERRNC